MGEDFVRDEAFLLASKQLDSNNDHQALAAEAPAVWSLVYGSPPRAPRRKLLQRRPWRRGGGAPRPGTLKAWKLKRRADVARAVEEAWGSGELAADAPPLCVDVHNEPYDIAEEALFQRRKRFKRALDSMRENSLTPAEQVAEFGSIEGAQQVMAAFNHISKTRVAEHLRKNQLKKMSRGHTEPTTSALHGKCVHVDKAIAMAVGRGDALDEALRAVGAIAAPARETADAFVVQNVEQPGQRAF